MDDYTDVSGALAEVIRELGSRSGVGAPIIVEGRLWGVMIAGAVGDEPLPADSEARLASFTELAATAIANADEPRSSRRLARTDRGRRR